jgi:hypothetical protein
MPVTVSLGWPTRSLVGAVIVPPLLAGTPHRTIGGHHREVSDLNFEVRNLDFTTGERLATLQP